MDEPNETFDEGIGDESSDDGIEEFKEELNVSNGRAVKEEAGHNPELDVHRQKSRGINEEMINGIPPSKLQFGPGN